MRTCLFISKSLRWEDYTVSIDSNLLKIATQSEVVFKNGDRILFVNALRDKKDILCGLNVSDIVVGDKEGLKWLKTHYDDVMICMIENDVRVVDKVDLNMISLVKEPDDGCEIKESNEQ